MLCCYLWFAGSPIAAFFNRTTAWEFADAINAEYQYDCAVVGPWQFIDESPVSL